MQLGNLRTGTSLPGLGSAAVWLGSALCALAVGVSIARGGVAWVVVGGIVGLALLPLVADRAFEILVGWTAVTALAFPFLRVPPYVTFDRVVILALIGGVILKARTLPRSYPTTLLTVAFGWMLVAFGLRAATDGVSALQTWLDAIVLPAILFVLVSRIAFTERRCQQIGAGLMVAGAGLGALGIAGKLVGFELASRTGGELRITSEQGGGTVTRISGPYQAPEVFAVALIVCFAATLYWILSRPTTTRLIWGLAAVSLEVAALALTLFRAGWIAGIIVVIVAFGLRPKRFARVLGVAVAIGAIGLAATTQLERNQTFETRFRNTDNVEGRLATYIEATHIFAAEPIFGVGVNKYSLAAPSFETVTVAGVAAVPFPHSTYFGMLAEQGLFGFLPLLASTIGVWYLLRMFRRRARNKHDVILAAATIGATLGYLLMSLTLTMLPYGQSNAFFAVLLGMVAARLDASSAQVDQSQRASSAR
jgi:O-antigen ligase